MSPHPAFAGEGGRVWVDPGRAVPAATAAGRAARATPPAGNGTIRVDLHGPLGLPGTAIELLAGDLAKALTHDGSPEEIARGARLLPADPPRTGYPHLSVGLAPGVDLGPGAGTSDWAGRALLDLRGAVEPLRGLILAGEVRMTPAARTETLSPAGDPADRSDLGAFADRPVRLGRAYMATAARLWPDGYGLLEAGMLEEMYGGLAGELLWRPFDARWSVAVEVQHLRKRRPDDAIAIVGPATTTAFLSAAWDATDDVAIGMAAGWFLGGAPGVELALDRRLGGLGLHGAGLTLGMILDGGIAPTLRLTIPIGAGGPFGSEALLRVRPQGRVAGQRLDRPTRLRELTGPASFGAVAASWDRLLH